MSDRATDVLVIGAGAAGLMCAIEAGRKGRRVRVIDHAERPAEKIRISGGGRCNFTNLHASPKQFLSNNPHFGAEARHATRFHCAERGAGKCLPRENARPVVLRWVGEGDHRHAGRRSESGGWGAGTQCRTGSDCEDKRWRRFPNLVSLQQRMKSGASPMLCRSQERNLHLRWHTTIMAWREMIL